MAWIAAYHDLVAETLAERARARGRRALAPGDRINAVVLRALSERFGIPAAALARALFPVRRPSPYRL
jgi:uncharacterized protein (DUF1501 family)